MKKNYSALLMLFVAMLLFWFLACGEETATTTDGGSQQTQDSGTQDTDTSGNTDAGQVDSSQPDAGQTDSGQIPDIEDPNADLLPGVGIKNSVQLQDSYQTVANKLGSWGTVNKFRKQTLDFEDAGLTIAFAGIKFDNKTNKIDNNDKVIRITALPKHKGQLEGGITFGSSRSDLEAITKYSQPDHLGKIPTNSQSSLSGTFALYFKEGLFVRYDQAEKIDGIILILKTKVVPGGTFTINDSYIQLPAGQKITYLPGASDPIMNHDQVQAILGKPDSTTLLPNQELPIKIAGQTLKGDLSFEIYNNLGLQVTYLDKVDGFASSFVKTRTVSVALFPPYFGQAANGLKLGLNKTEVEHIFNNQIPTIGTQNNITVHVYKDKKSVGIVYSEGATDADKLAIGIILQYPEKQ